MDSWQALVLGIVEGLTEYLPVSSTGHLVLAQRAMGLAKDEAADAYAIVIQGGAILAVLGLYRHRVAQMFAGLLGRDPEGRRLLACLLVAMVPLAGVVPLEKLIKARLFNLPSIAAAWLVGGVAILAASAWRRRRATRQDAGHGLAGLTWQAGLLIGLAQCVAVWPGTSRSLVTIVAGLLVGLEVGAAVEFSFLLGVATLSGATLLDAIRSGDEMMAAYGAGPLAVGFVAAFVSAVVAVKWMVSYLGRHGLAVFGWYRIGIALVVAALMAAGVLTDSAGPAAGPGEGEQHEEASARG